MPHRAIISSRPRVGFGQLGRSSPGRSRTAVADCLSDRARRGPIRGPGVILGRKGVVGSVYYIPADYWPHKRTAAK
jgi:hypothetical protein